MEHKIILKDPADLSIHPLAKLAPDWAKDDERFESLVEDISGRGIDCPLMIDSQDRVVRGRKRFRAARQLQIREVPCQVVEDQEVASIILNNLMIRAHYTKGQRAYLAYPLLQTAHDEAKARARAKASENLKKGNEIPRVYQWTQGQTVQDIAKRFGICRALFFQAQNIHDRFQNPKKFLWTHDPFDGDRELTIKEYFEPQIMRAEDPVGLGAALAGIAAKLSGKTVDQGRNTQLDLFRDGWSGMDVRFRYWENFNAQEKAEAIEVLRESATKMPADLRKEFKAALVAAEKERA